MWEDNIVKNKLNGLDTLPEGYTPNLESKWGMLEAGLEGSRRRVWAWKPYAAAAMFLMLGGAGILLMKPKPKPRAEVPAMHMPVATAEKQAKAQLQNTPGPAAKYIAKAKTLSYKPKIQHIAVTVNPDPNMQPETTVVSVLQPIQREQPGAVTKTKKPRFVEVDFNDAPVAAEKPSESVIAAQQFKFRIGINSVSANPKSESGGSIWLQQSF